MVELYDSELVQLIRRVADNPEATQPFKEVVESVILDSAEFQEMRARWGSLPGALSEYKIRKIRQFGGWLNREGIKGRLSFERLLRLADDDILVCWLELWALGEIRG